MFFSCALEIPRVRSWPKPFSIAGAGPTSPPIAQAAIPPGRFAPRRCGKWSWPGCMWKGFAARVGTNLRSRARRKWISFTVCDNAASEVCPVWPGQPMTAHWGVADPAAVHGTPEQIDRAFRDAFMILDRRISLFLCLPLSTLNQLAIKKEIDRIGLQ
jgi:hypothetical protein